VVIAVKSLGNTTLLVEGDASFNHVIGIPDLAPSKRDRVLLSLSPLPLGFQKITFDWDDPVRYPMPLPMSFPVRDIIRYIIETIYSTSALSSSTCRALSFPKLMSAICKILTFCRRPT
jgi:hypothetical protein